MTRQVLARASTLGTSDSQPLFTLGDDSQFDTDQTLAYFGYGVARDRRPQTIANTVGELKGVWTNDYATDEALIIFPLRLAFEGRDYLIRNQLQNSPVASRPGAALRVSLQHPTGAALTVSGTLFEGSGVTSDRCAFFYPGTAAVVIDAGAFTDSDALKGVPASLEVADGAGGLEFVPPVPADAIDFEFWATVEASAADFNTVRLSAGGELQPVAQRQLTLRARADERFLTPGLHVEFGRDGLRRNQFWAITSLDESDAEFTVLNLVADLAETQ